MNDPLPHHNQKWARPTVAAFIAAGLLLIPLSRLPLLASPHLVLDGDEAIVGLMAKQMSEGRRWPMYFDGQSFGLSIVETAAGALAFRVYRPSTEGLKVAMLALWIVGWAFFVLAVHRWCDAATAIVAGVLLATSPAWGNWSMMARGYHVGGFVLAQILLWWLSTLRAKPRIPAPQLFVTAGLLALLALTQALWLVAVMPFAALVLWESEHRVRDAARIAAGTGAVFLVATALLRGSSSYWSPGYLGRVDLVGAPGRLARATWVCLSGAHYYRVRLPAGPFNVLSTGLWAATCGAAAAWFAAGLRAGIDLVAWAAAAAIGLVLAAAALMAPGLFAYRHLLALTTPIVMLAAMAMVAAARRGGAFRVAGAATLAVLAFTGVVAILEEPQLWKTRANMAGAPDRVDLDALVDALVQHDFDHVYSLDGMLQWNLMFSSNEQLAARWKQPEDRRPEIPREVDGALWNGQRIALVGEGNQMKSILERLAETEEPIGSPHMVGQHYFWIEQPTPQALTALGFRLNSPGISRPALGHPRP
jgi:hypothetical protein